MQAEAISQSIYNPWRTKSNGKSELIKTEDSGILVHGDSEEWNTATLGWFERMGFERVVENAWIEVEVGAEG